MAFQNADPASSVHRQFASPYEPKNLRVWNAIAESHARAVVSGVIEQCSPADADASRSLLAYLRQWLTQPADFDTVWDMAFGRAQWALESHESDPLEPLVQVGLRLAARGIEGEWTATLPSKTRLLWDRWLLPEAQALHVRACGDRATIRLDAVGVRAAEVRCVRNATEWLVEGAERLCVIGPGRPLTVLPSYAVSNDLLLEDAFHSIVSFPDITAEVTEPFEQALQVLSRYSPTYIAWVGNVLRGLVICRCDNSRTRSSSWTTSPGVILISRSHPLEIAEMLVHEASHQYFHLVTRIGSVDDGSDREQYFSPAVNRPRPVDRVLIGYHAFANVLLMYQELLSRGFPDSDGHCAQMIVKLRGDIDMFEGPLRKTPALTEIGRGLCHPLMERLAAAATS